MIPHRHPHAQVSALAVDNLPSGVRKVLRPGERPGSCPPPSRDDMRDPGAALLVQAMRATGMSQRWVGRALQLSPAAMAGRCFRGGVDLTELAALVRTRPALVGAIVELLSAMLEANAAPVDPTVGALAIQADAGKLATEVLGALGNDGRIDENEAQAIDVVLAKLGASTRRMRVKPRGSR